VSCITIHKYQHWKYDSSLIRGQHKVHMLTDVPCILVTMFPQGERMNHIAYVFNLAIINPGLPFLTTPSSYAKFHQSLSTQPWFGALMLLGTSQLIIVLQFGFSINFSEPYSLFSSCIYGIWTLSQ
jgi:hypothetical protein